MTATFDPRIPGAFTAPDYFERLAELRADAPVHQLDDDVFTVARYQEVRAISRNPADFCSSRGVLVNDPLRFAPADMSGSVLHMDPPDHAAYRKLVNREFTPLGVSGLEARIRELAVEVLGAIAPDEVVDFVESVAAPFPVPRWPASKHGSCSKNSWPGGGPGRWRANRRGRHRRWYVG